MVAYYDYFTQERDKLEELVRTQEIIKVRQEKYNYHFSIITNHAGSGSTKPWNTDNG